MEEPQVVPEEQIAKSIVAYIAGFFDGEGCIHARIRNNAQPNAVLTISQKNPKVLYWITKTVGYGHVTECYNEKWVRNIWRVTGRDKTKSFIKMILPFSKVKKKQLQVGLKLLALIGKPGDHPVSKSNLTKRLKLHNKLKELKR